MASKVVPRIYCLVATAAPVVAVFLRGPTRWFHVGRWDLTKQVYEPGAWLLGRLFPRRSDVSPDGQWLCYFARKPGATWKHGETYIAISKLPWLTALYAFGTCGSWTRGYYFTEDGSCDDPDKANLPIPYGIKAMPIMQFANERRRGWSEAPDSPPQQTNDTWDEQRNVHMQKRQPGDSRVLHLECLGCAGGEFGVNQAMDGFSICYSLEADGDLEVLDDLQWADWDTAGRLLVATRCGKLQIRTLNNAQRFETVFEENLSLLKPTPVPSPPWAQIWESTP